MKLELNTKAIRVRIVEKDMTRHELAQMVGISDFTLRRVLNGADCRLSTFLRVLEALDLQPNEAIITK